MKRALIITAIAVAALVGHPAPAAADLTAFWGFSPTPESRRTGGFAAGVSLVVVGFEFEYAKTTESDLKGAPGLTTGMFNALIQTPSSGMQLYVTVGGGLYRENYRDLSESSFGTNVGGGVKLSLMGPVRIRLDYRVFSLRGNPLYPAPKRFYAGANIAF